MHCVRRGRCDDESARRLREWVQDKPSRSAIDEQCDTIGIESNPNEPEWRTENAGFVRRDGVASSSNARASNAVGGDSRGRMVKNFPYPEFLKRKEEGHCFRCGGPFAPGHRCAERSLRVLLLA